MEKYIRFFENDFYNDKKIKSTIELIFKNYKDEDIVNGKIDKGFIDIIYPLIFDFKGNYISQISQNLANDMNIERNPINDQKLESIVYFLKQYDLSKKSLDNILNLHLKVGNKYKQILVVGGIVQDRVYKNVTISSIDKKGNVSLTFKDKTLTVSGDRLKLL